MKEEVDIQWLDEVDSTNNEALRNISGIDNLSVLAALHQTSGRGQRGNSWATPNFSSKAAFMVRTARRKPHILSGDEVWGRSLSAIEGLKAVPDKPERHLGRA